MKKMGLFFLASIAVVLVTSTLWSFIFGYTIVPLLSAYPALKGIWWWLPIKVTPWAIDILGAFLTAKIGLRMFKDKTVASSVIIFAAVLAITTAILWVAAPAITNPLMSWLQVIAFIFNYWVVAIFLLVQHGEPILFRFIFWEHALAFYVLAVLLFLVFKKRHVGTL